MPESAASNLHQSERRVLVCGSRDWGDPEPIAERLSRLPRSTTIVHGDASRKVDGVEVSADRLADRIAVSLGFLVERYPADWKNHGRAAGVIRNVFMLDTGIDRVLAFQRNGSRGTQHTIDEARRRGIPVEVFDAA